MSVDTERTKQLSLTGCKWGHKSQITRAPHKGAQRRRMGSFNSYTLLGQSLNFVET